MGEGLVEGSPLAKTQKKVKKDSESLDVVDVCTRLKNENTSEYEKNNLKNTKYQNVNWRGPSFYIELARGEGRPLPLTLMCVWLSFQIKEALFAALKLTFYINYKRLLHLMAIFRSVSDSTRVLALC